MDGKNGLVLWVLGGTGVLFLYSAYKAKSPQEVLISHLGVSTSQGPRESTQPVPFTGQRYMAPSVPGNTAKGGWKIV
jgi:hypothetical protein